MSAVQESALSALRKTADRLRRAQPHHLHKAIKRLSDISIDLTIEETQKRGRARAAGPLFDFGVAVISLVAMQPPHYDATIAAAIEAAERLIAHLKAAS